MSQLGPFLRKMADDQIAFFCPGCQRRHVVRIGGNPRARPIWSFNGNPESPTITPSVVSRSGHYMPNHVEGDPCWCDGDSGFACEQCHLFVSDGKIRFLPDCSHELAGETVPMVPVPFWP